MQWSTCKWSIITCTDTLTCAVNCIFDVLFISL